MADMCVVFLGCYGFKIWVPNNTTRIWYNWIMFGGKSSIAAGESFSPMPMSITPFIQNTEYNHGILAPISWDMAPPKKRCWNCTLKYVAVPP